MNPQSSTQHRNPRVTLLEVMIVLVVIACLGVFVFLPYLTRGHSHGSHARTHCVNNLKMIGLSHRQWAMDHGDRYPAAVAASQGGVLGHRSSHQAWPYWVVLSNEVNTPRVLRCPKDDGKREAQAFDGTVTDANISYFVGLAADETKPTVILSGTSAHWPRSPLILRMWNPRRTPRSADSNVMPPSNALVGRWDPAPSELARSVWLERGNSEPAARCAHREAGSCQSRTPSSVGGSCALGAGAVRRVGA